MRSRAPRVHYSLSILVHNEKEAGFFYFLLLSLPPLYGASLKGKMNESFIDSLRGLVRRTIAVSWIPKLRWGLARLCLQNLGEPRMSVRAFQLT